MAAPMGRKGFLLGSLWRQSDSAVKSSVSINTKSMQTHFPLWTKSQPQEQMSRTPEYIPQRKAKNPMKKVGLAWAIGFPSGILLFLFAKREVDKKRLDQLKVRLRMKEANQGEYERQRFNRAS
ncbi:hypothetical protein GDO86_019200 [Hymenochirus boettgeri]|uniref:Uncharacterized protein n=1 Tax=Hymenochirus boettgeri TaxID=247094 RepID=A0A8T2IJG4_9PIPI|nr:hypothetical protein GDO86_019200 [Hymenochirus boettgeri]